MMGHTQHQQRHVFFSDLHLKNRFKNQLRRQFRSPRPVKPKSRTQNEQSVVDAITLETKRQNRDNISRAAAYLHLFQHYPELEWAFLAHMVSRNSGWNMTDLKGAFLKHLLDASTASHFFLFFERANALIFQDAFPQLLLYAESRKRNKPLFYLLPDFAVSSFMTPFWTYFWEQQDREWLSLALIVNEQQYIEKRVIQNREFQKHVFRTTAFRAQGFSQMSHVIFPYFPATVTDDTLRFAGLIIENFTDLNERIEFGKQLYTILFGIPEVRQGSLAFARSVPHTGSRSDYEPRQFSPDPSVSVPYSPFLEDVWPPVPLPAVSSTDWFTDLSALRHLTACRIPRRFDMTTETGARRRTLALAAKASKKAPRSPGKP